MQLLFLDSHRKVPPSPPSFLAGSLFFYPLRLTGQYLSTSPQHSRVATDCPIAFTALLGFKYQLPFALCVHEHLPHNSKHRGCINEIA